jgi:hypothetical protein
MRLATMLKIDKVGGDVEKYVLVCLLVELAIVVVLFVVGGLPVQFSASILILASLRIAEILQTTVNAVLFGEKVASAKRAFILATINFVELGLCFGFLPG